MIVLSDYAKGVVGGTVASTLIADAHADRRVPIPAFAVDGIPIREIERAADTLLRSHHADAGPVPASLYLERVQ